MVAGIITITIIRASKIKVSSLMVSDSSYFHHSKYFLDLLRTAFQRSNIHTCSGGILHIREVGLAEGSCRFGRLSQPCPVYHLLPILTTSF